MTFTILPSVSGPTGTFIASPVSVTLSPLFKPSVVSIDIVLTVPSPKCCATSKTNLFPLLSHSRAEFISGKCSSNFTSTTAPITWVIIPNLFCIFFSFIMTPHQK